MARFTLLECIERLNRIGISLSVEKDHRKLLAMILRGARELTGADGGTLYLLREDGCLHFEIVFTESLGIHIEGQDDGPGLFPPIPLRT